MSTNSIEVQLTKVKPDIQLAQGRGKSSLNQHELTNQYRRLAAEFGMPACVEQQTTAEWLSDYDASEVCA